ncbi:hypothetical protein CEK71_22300 [Methylovulum psychrotolerans]|uniref:Uncharacterized protein n=1 Tax=Methylovulum psychrotolerans TaxID=1704499 RepID=A0A1Z4C4T0_9GAMM|nr:hypothetical protein CEK71_22300 [Methylovulum psychrotolerans]
MAVIVLGQGMSVCPKAFSRAPSLRPPQAGCWSRRAKMEASTASGVRLGDDFGRLGRSANPASPSVA